MTKKDYIVIAGVFKKQNKVWDSIEDYTSEILGKLMDIFLADNSRFDAQKFLDAVNGK